jgi:A118 family predicted phage portal protein
VVRECAFATTRTERGREYLYLQLHLLNPDGTYRIENRLYAAPDAGSGDGDFPAEVSLAELQATGDSAPVFLTGSTEPLFFLNTPNIANNLAPEIPMGVSVFANAIDQLMDCDNIFDSLNSEFVLGRKRIMVKPEAIRNLEGEPLFDANDLVFYILPEDSQNGSTIHEIDTSLRIPAHVSGLQVALDLLGLKCGFGPNHWKFDAGHITTATQILSANSEEYRTQQKHQLVLESLLIRFTRTMLRLGRDFLNLPLDPDIPVSVDFDQSTVENAGEEFERDIQMLDHGILSKEEFRMKWLNEDKKTAKDALSDVISETQE